MRFLCLAMIFACLLPQTALAETHTLVRGFIWGASKEDVRKFEIATFWEEKPGQLRFFEGGDGYQTGEFDPKIYRKTIDYDFNGNSLAKITYDYSNLAPPNPDMVFNLYMMEYHALSQKYGKPTSEQAIWKNKLYKNKPEFWPRALDSDDLKLVTEWDVADTKIVLQCFGVGAYYRLFWTAEKAGTGAADKMRGLLEIPAVKTPAAKGAGGAVAQP